MDQASRLNFKPQALSGGPYIGIQKKFRFLKSIIPNNLGISKVLKSKYKDLLPYYIPLNRKKFYANTPPASYAKNGNIHQNVAYRLQYSVYSRSFKNQRASRQLSAKKDKRVSAL